MGWSSIDGTLNLERIRLAFRDAYKCLEDFPGFSFIKETIYDHCGFLGPMLLKLGVNKHPLKNVIMLDFMFDEPDDFFSEYERVLSASIGLSKRQLWTELTDSRNSLKLLVTDAGYSFHAASQQLGIPLSQAISYLRKEGIEYKQRHRVLDQQKEEALINLFNVGEESDVICSKLGISKSFIFSYLAKQTELRNSWRAAQQRRLSETHRSRFLQFLKDNPSLPVKVLRTTSESSYQWLKTNDKSWLKQNLPGIWQKSSHE
jgi:LAS superfamily LD-carboxypeptidase LdcB